MTAEGRAIAAGIDAVLFPKGYTRLAPDPFRRPAATSLVTFKARCIVDDNGCWLWGGAMDPSGYGKIKVDGRSDGAHRVSYRLAGNDIPAGFDVDHLCRVRQCVNPDHLEAVTRAENMRRAVQGHMDESQQRHPTWRGVTTS